MFAVKERKKEAQESWNDRAASVTDLLSHVS